MPLHVVPFFRAFVPPDVGFVPPRGGVRDRAAADGSALVRGPHFSQRLTPPGAVRRYIRSRLQEEPRPEPRPEAMVWSRLKATLTRARVPTPPAPDPDAPPRAVPDGTVVYAVGDIHGRLDLLTKLTAQITAHAAGVEAARKVIVCVGDYVDRGPDSKGVIDFLLDFERAQGPAGFTLKCLIGNHERMMIDFLAEPGEVGQMWLRNGGLETLQSYGVAFDIAAPRMAAFQAARDAFAAALPARHKDFLDQLLLTHREGDYLFVHAGLKPGVAIDAQREADMLWIRGPFLHTPADYGCLVVHGHTITPEPEWEAWRIGIDTGAFYTGRLTALALVGERQEIIQAVA